MYLGRSCLFESHEETGTEASTLCWILVIFRDSAQKKPQHWERGMKYERRCWINFSCKMIGKYWEQLKSCTYFTIFCFPYEQVHLPQKQVRTIEGEVHNYKWEEEAHRQSANMWSVLWKKVDEILTRMWSASWFTFLSRNSF